MILRAHSDEDGWRETIDQLAAGSRTLLGLWGDPPNVHMALCSTRRRRHRSSVTPADGTFPSVVQSIHRRSGWSAHPRPLCSGRRGAVDRRPWLDHAQPYDFLPPRRKPASDRGRRCMPASSNPGIFVYRQWRTYRAAGAAARLCAQGHRATDGGATLDAASKLAARTSATARGYSYAFAWRSKPRCKSATAARDLLRA